MTEPARVESQTMASGDDRDDFICCKNNRQFDRVN